MSSFLCEGTWEIVRVLSCIMRGFFDLVERNKESFFGQYILYECRRFFAKERGKS